MKTPTILAKFTPRFHRTGGSVAFFCGLKSAPGANCQSKTRRPAGFTFVELLVVIAIIMTLIGLILIWGVGARRANKIRSTQAIMSNLLLAADTVKNASPIYPDHRLANYFYVQKHTVLAGTVPSWNNANYRRMSSGEFLAFLATLVPSSSTMVQVLGSEYLKPSAPSLMNVPMDDSGILVDVFQWDPAHPQALDKIPVDPAVAASFSLVSDPAGYRLRAPVDAWGNPLCFRLYTHRDDLNQADREVPNPNPNGLNAIREKIIQDEQFTRERYEAQGLLPASAPVTELVRPAVPAYANPMFMSAGPDGQWGQFVDLAPPNVAPNYTRDGMAEKTAARDALAQDNIYSQEAGR